MRSLSDENKPVTLWPLKMPSDVNKPHGALWLTGEAERSANSFTALQWNAQQMLRKEFRNREIRSKQNERTKYCEEKPCLRYRLTVCPPCTVCVHWAQAFAVGGSPDIGSTVNTQTHTHSIRSHSRCKLQLCFVVISRFADSKLWHFGCLFIRPFFIHFIHSRWHWHIPCHSILLFCTFCSRRCCCCCCAVVGWCSAMIRRWLLCLSTRTWRFVLYFNLN